METAGVFTYPGNMESPKEEMIYTRKAWKLLSFPTYPMNIEDIEN